MRTYVTGAEVDHNGPRGPPANSAFAISIAFICTYAIFALAVLPFAANPGPVIPGITAAFVATVFVTELSTSFLLFVHFRANPHWSLLILGSAFLYSALMVVPHLLTFPGAVLADQTLVGSSRQASGYIFVLWVIGFALLTFVSVLFEARDSRHQFALVRVDRAVFTAVSAVSAVVLSVILIAILLDDHLPALVKLSPRWTVYSHFVILIAIALFAGSIAIVLLSIRNELFLWLVMALATDVIASIVTEVGGARYTVGWLIGRLTWIISGCVLFLYFLRQFARQREQLVASDRALRASEQHFQMLVQGVKEYAIYMLDPEGYITSWNSGAEYIEGYREEEIIGQHFSRFYMPEDQQGGLPATALKQAKKRGKYEAEGWRVRKDGSRFWASVVVTPIFREEEALIGFAKIVRDFSRRKAAEQHQELLVAELDHRVKNILAQVAVVAVSTSQGSRSIDEFLRSLNGRIQSMAAAHTLLSKSGWQTVGLDALVRNQLAPYATDTNVTINGTDVVLSAAETQAVAKVLHELVTNAAKHGALSIPGGHVSVNWDRKSNGDGANLLLDWQEHGGPPVKSEAQSSYGTDLIRNLIPHELGGKVDLVFASDGVSCRIEIPIGHRSRGADWRNRLGGAGPRSSASKK
jgi:PAS domain S-box-containing protein